MGKIVVDSIENTEWEKLLKEIKNKKIVIFGAGNNGKVLLDLLPYDVAYFIDNDQQKWNKELNNIPIKNPEILKAEKEDLSILLGGYLYEDMIKQLSGFNLGENIYIYNIYKIMEQLLNKISFSNSREGLINFLNTVPDNIIVNNRLSREKISILISNYSFSSNPLYSMVLGVMLKSRGNNVEFIWDDLEGFDEIYYNNENMTAIQNEVIAKGLNYVNERFDIKITKVSKMGLEDLDDKDIKELKKLSKANTISKYRKVFLDMECKEYEKKCFKVLGYGLKKIKYLFKKYKIEKIIIYTGIHKKTGLYTHIARTYNTQLFSYDGSHSMLLTTDGICTHYEHIEKIILENKLDNEVLKKMIKFAEENFNKRLNSSNDIDSYVYQKVEYDEKITNYKYDIIIPLNIAWDAAALGHEGIFDSMAEWLLETINYILENTNASVAARQHPAERFFDSGEDIREQLENNFSNNPRFKYISSDEQINTYNLIKNSKVVLPHTSTVGIESALLNKPVIMATYSYYANMSFVKKASSQEEYFSLIKSTLDGKTTPLSNEAVEQAKLCYALMMLTAIPTKFTDLNMNYWVKQSFEDLYKDKTVQDILSIFESGDPIDIYKAENRFINVEDITI